MFSVNRFQGGRKCEDGFGWLWLVCVLPLALGYNIDTESVKIFRDPKSWTGSRSSYFGYSMALYAGGSGGFAEASILVGAPRANDTRTPWVLEPGTVYNCRIEGEECTQWHLDDTGNGDVYLKPRVKASQNKDNAWIGANIGVGQDKDGSDVVVCAPRWKNNVTAVIRSGRYHDLVNENRWYIQGMCYWTKVVNSRRFQHKADYRLLPLLDDKLYTVTWRNVAIYNYAMGQTGTSLHLYSENNDTEILLGNPGVHNWKGVPILLKGRLEDRPLVPYVGQEALIPDFVYFGYSVSSGSYLKPGERWYSAGAPRSANMKGRVLIYRFSNLPDKRLIVSSVLDGQRYGEYFGASLASCDVNNDGKDEVIVGAPLWSRHMDEGRVYVHSIKSNGEVLQQHIDGEVIGARFGSVVTCLGDLDHDGYEDIAVGAPYENDHGAIYIFNGRQSGLSRRYSQRIAGESISESIRGFGAAISEPRDIDGNFYSDIAVGAYVSGHAVLLRSQPVVAIGVNVAYLGGRELEINTTSFVVDVCSSYEGVHVPERLHVEAILKVDPTQGRAYFGGNASEDGLYRLPVVLHRGVKTCDRFKINLVKDIKNSVEPMEIGVSLALTKPTVPNRESKKFCPLCPVVDEARSKMDHSIRLPFAVGCGPDNVCTSNLDTKLSADLEHGNRYTLGSETTVRLAIRVANHGEPAYNTEIYVLIPRPVSLRSVPPECSENTENVRQNETFRVTCQLGNPLRVEATSILELDMRGITTDLGSVVFSSNVTTESVNIAQATNTRSFTIFFDADVDIAIAGKSEQDEYSYLNKADSKLSEKIRFHHVYEVQKFGASPVEESVLTVLVPTHWRSVDNGSYVEIASVNQTFGIMEGRLFRCDIFTPMQDDKFAGDNTMLQVSRLDNRDDGQTPGVPSFTTDSNSVAPLDNQTLYLNCTSPAIACTRISCNLGSFSNSLIVAKLTLTLDLQLRNLQKIADEEKDVINFETHGNVVITQPQGFVQRVENKPDSVSVSTKFVELTIESHVAVWIIALSVFLGILLLVLLALGLLKLGFFHRKKREELNALKAESDKSHGFVLETSSSKEALDTN